MFLNLVLEKTLESPLGQQGDQTSQSSRKLTLNTHWKDWCWSWSSNTLATWCKGPLHWKRLWCWERLKAQGEGVTEDEMVGRHHRSNGHEFEQILGDSEGQGSLAFCSPWGRKESDMTEWLDWTELNWKKSYDKHRWCIRKQSHHFADKGLSTQIYGFSSSHVWMWQLDHKATWVLKNWCFWIWCSRRLWRVPLDSKEIKPVSPQGN